MAYFSNFYDIEVREEIAKEFTDSSGNIDDMMAGLHEIRAKLSKEDNWLQDIHNKLTSINMKRNSFITSR